MTRACPRLDLSSNSGSAAVEFAIWLLILVPALLNIVDLGLYEYQRTQVSNVAQTLAQTAWRRCYNYAPTSADVSTCVAGYATSTIAAASRLGADVHEDTAQRHSEYYCANTSGALVANGASSTCSSGAQAGYYLKVAVYYDFTPVFRATSVTSLLNTRITQTSTIRLS